MIRAALLLADFAETDSGSGKVHLLGVGWSLTGPAPAPHAVVGYLQVPADRAPEGPILFTIRLVDKAGHLVEVPGPAGMQRLEISGQVEMNLPDDWDHSTELQATFAANLTGLPLPPGQSYTWLLEIDGKELASTQFQVRAATASSPAQPGS